MLILLSQNEQGISALDLQKHIFPSGSSSMKSTFPWMQRHCVNYYKEEQLYETNRRETALTHPRGGIGRWYRIVRLQFFSFDLFSYIHINTYIQQITYLFPRKNYRRQHRIWVFVSFVQKIAI